MNKKKIIFVVSVLTITFVICIILVIINRNSNPVVTEQNQDDETSAFVGDLVKAELPKGWEIKEYNSDSKEELILSDGEYSGLVSLEILNGDNVIFSMDGVSGVGYQIVCNEIFKFHDTASSYVTQKEKDYKNYNLVGESQSSENLSEQALITELDSTYTEFNIFDRQVRRIGKNLYWNVKNSTDFNPECGPTSHFIEFTELKFYSTYNGGQQYTMSLYTARISDNVSEDQLLKLDQILNSLEII